MGFKDAGKPHYFGHRERLRRRFREGGADALPDYELLALILFRAGRPVLGSWQAVIDYCRATMGFENKEQFRML